MAKQITKQELIKLIEITSSNFKFKLPDSFEMLFSMVYEQVKTIDRSLIQKRVEQLLLTNKDEWNKRYGYSGYPSLSDWLEILTGRKPLTDEEILKRKKEHAKKLTVYASTIVVWVNDPNLSISFCNRYKKPENHHLKMILDCYCKVKEELPRERIIKMAEYLKKKHEENKQLFLDQMRGIADNQNQLLLT